VARSLKIRGEEAEITVELGAGPTAQALWEVLPLESRASLWGEEIYFPIPLSVEGEPDAREEVEVGTVAYWPPGVALCLFFGPTPASTDDNPRAASPVTVVGEVVDGIEDCRRVSSGELLRVEAAGEK
jgi:uncharacterized protein